MPEIQKELDGRYNGTNMQVFAISTGDPEWYMEAFKAELGVTFPWLSMDIAIGTYFAELYNLYQLDTNEGHPTVMLLDQDGIIRFRDTGYGGVNEEDLNYRAAFDLIGELLEEAGQISGNQRAEIEIQPSRSDEEETPVQEVQALEQIGWEVGNQAPNFSLSDMQDNNYTLSDYRGTVIVLDFWSWGCSACGDPNHVFDFKWIYREYPQDQVTVLSVDTYTDPDIVALDDYLTSQRIWYPVLINGLEASYKYRVARTPVLFIIDKDGVIQYRKQTNQFDEEAQEILDALMANLSANSE